jgi:uncharacterized protein (TIGR02145 family)
MNNRPVAGATNRTYIYTPAATANERDSYTFFCLISNDYSTNVKSNELSVIVEQATLGVLKGIPLRKDDGMALYVSAQHLGQESSIDGGYTGDLYQYGRAADGHEKQNSPVTTTQATNAVAPYEPAEVIGKFIDHAPWSSDPDFANGWTVKDPCPSGWHLPTLAEWQSVTPTITGNPSGSQHVTLTFDESKACFFLTDGQNVVIQDLSTEHEAGMPSVTQLTMTGWNQEWFSRLWTASKDVNLKFELRLEEFRFHWETHHAITHGFRIKCVLN